MRLLLFVVIFAFSQMCVAEQQRGKLTGYIPTDVNGREVLIFQIENNVSGGCNVTGRFAIDSTSLSYKGIFSAAIAAFHSQSSVSIIYFESCNSYGNAWDVRAICVGNLPC